MVEVRREWRVLTGLLLFAAVIFLSGLNWGLPSRAADPFLFGAHAVWTGREIMDRLPAETGRERGADVDENPLLDRSRAVVLNETDAQRAEIVRRYRMFSYQPDEMITFMALSGMNPSKGDLDPRLYQYGGLWIYPVGAMLKVGSAVGLVDVRADKAFYLDHPEKFGRFYVVARLYTALWALVGVAVVFWTARRFSDDLWVPACAAVAYALLPVVVYSSHEAKPHLPGAVLSLAAILMGMRYVERGRWADVLGCGALCGAALGMVVSAVVMFALVPVVVLAGPRRSWGRRVGMMLAAGVVGVMVYGATNPYVWINAIWHRERLASNLGNSLAMYRAGWGEAIANAAWLMLEGTSTVVGLIGLAGAVGLGARMWRDARLRARLGRVALVLGVPAILVAIPFALVAGGKPAEHARFAILPDIVLMLAAVAACEVLVVEVRRRRWALGLLVAGAAVPGLIYLGGYVADATGDTTRLRAAEELRAMAGGRGLSVALAAEPAPYSVPPLNLFDWTIVLMPRPGAFELPAGADVAIRAVDDAGKVKTLPTRGYPPAWLPSPMSWAAKRFEVIVRDGARDAPGKSGG
jgi:hypothetical protein